MIMDEGYIKELSYSHLNSILTSLIRIDDLKAVKYMLENFDTYRLDLQGVLRFIVSIQMYDLLSQYSTGI